MTLFSLVISLVILYYRGTLVNWQQTPYVQQYLDFWAQHAEHTPLWQPMCIPFLLLLPILVGVVLVQCFLSPLLFGVVGIILSVAALCAVLGATFLQKQQKWQDENTQTETFFWLAHEELFGIIFWFAVLGLTGAVFYRLLSVYTRACEQDQRFSPAMIGLQRVHGVLAWIPARLTALGYLLVGNFDHGFAPLKAHFGQHDSQSLLVETGRAALDGEDTDDDAMHRQSTVARAVQLIQRTLLLWVVGIAVCTIVMIVA